MTAPLVIKNLKGKFCLPVKCSLNETGSVFFELSHLAALKEYFQGVIDFVYSNQFDSFNSLYDSDLKSQLSLNVDLSDDQQLYFAKNVGRWSLEAYKIKPNLSLV